MRILQQIIPVISFGRHSHRCGFCLSRTSVPQVQRFKMAAGPWVALLMGSSELILEMDLLAGNRVALIFCRTDTCKSWWGGVAFPLLPSSSWFQNGARTEWTGPEQHCRQEWWTVSHLGMTCLRSLVDGRAPVLVFPDALYRAFLWGPHVPTRICMLSVFTLRKYLLEPWFISKCKMDVLDALMLIRRLGLRAQCHAFNPW